MYDVSQVMDSWTKQNICKVNIGLDSDRLHPSTGASLADRIKLLKSTFLSKLLWPMAELFINLSRGL